MAFKFMTVPKDIITDLFEHECSAKDDNMKNLFYEEKLLKGTFLEKKRQEQEKQWQGKTDLEKIEWIPGLDEKLDATIMHGSLAVKYWLSEWTQKELEDDIDIEVKFHVSKEREAGKKLSRARVTVWDSVNRVILYTNDNANLAHYLENEHC